MTELKGDLRGLWYIVVVVTGPTLYNVNINLGVGNPLIPWTSLLLGKEQRPTT